MESRLDEEGRETVDGAVGKGLREGVRERSQSRCISSEVGRRLEGWWGGRLRFQKGTDSGFGFG